MHAWLMLRFNLLSYPIPLVPPVTRAVIPSSDHLLSFPSCLTLPSILPFLNFQRDRGKPGEGGTEFIGFCFSQPCCWYILSQSTSDVMSFFQQKKIYIIIRGLDDKPACEMIAESPRHAPLFFIGSWMIFYCTWKSWIMVSL